VALFPVVKRLELGLLSSPARGALLNERQGALLEVLGLAQSGQGSVRELALLLLGQDLHGVVHDLQRHANGQGSIDGDLIGKLQGLVENLSRLGEAVHESKLVSALSRDGVSCEKHLQGDMARHLTRKAVETSSRGDERTLHLRDTKLRLGRGHDL